MDYLRHIIFNTKLKIMKLYKEVSLSSKPSLKISQIQMKLVNFLQHMNELLIKISKYEKSKKYIYIQYIFLKINFIENLNIYRFFFFMVCAFDFFRNKDLRIKFYFILSFHIKESTINNSFVSNQKLVNFIYI